MFLFETTFGLDEVLRMHPGKDNDVRQKLVDLAWDRWCSADPEEFKKYDDVAYATVKIEFDEFVVTIEFVPTCDRETYMLYGRYLHEHDI